MTITHVTADGADAARSRRRTRRLQRNAAAFLVWTAALASASSATSVAKSAVKAGEYIGEYGWGTLQIRQEPTGNTSFSIHSSGANGHTCDLSGDIEGSSGITTAEPGLQPCTVRFKQRNGAVELTDDGSVACRAFCGARAGYKGVYLVPAAGCTSPVRRKTRDTFDALYRAKAYAPALAALSPLLSACAKTLAWSEAAQIRNDLAVTQYHLGQRTACRQTLRPLLAETSGEQLELLRQHAPSDFEASSKVAAVTRHNDQLCGGPGP